MNDMKHILAISTLIFILNSCTEKALTPQEYVQWVQDKSNGLKANQAFQDVIFEAQYKPHAYVALLEHNQTGDGVSVDERVKEIEDLQYFDLRLKPKDGLSEVLGIGAGSKTAYYNRVHYYSYEFKPDIHLIDGQDTLPCRVHNFVQYYGISPHVDVVLGFPTTDKQGDKILCVNDRVFGKGQVKLSIKSAAINNIPKLKS